MNVKFLFCNVLVISLCLVVFGQAVSFGAISLDDPQYITDNQLLWHGSFKAYAVWAFQHTVEGAWMPVTWLSYYMDKVIYSQWLGGFHITNLLLHIITSLILLRLLYATTSQLAPSLLTTTIFAIHPLQVEPVIWLASRKDVLSGLFFTAALFCYYLFSQTRDRRLYVAVTVFFILGAMSKQAIVTLPFILVLLDIWSLKKIPIPTVSKPVYVKQLKQSIIEKLPLFFLALLFCFIPYVAHEIGGRAWEKPPIAERIINIPVYYYHYITTFYWPNQLTFHFRDEIPTTHPSFSLLVFSFILVALYYTLKTIRHYPFLFVGTAWFFGMLIPVIGIIPFGVLPIADRYTYLPLIGLAIISVWGCATIARQLSISHRLISLTSTLFIIVLALYSLRQVDYWSSEEKLWRNAIDINEKGLRATRYLANVYLAQRECEQAQQVLHQALDKDESGEIHAYLGSALVGLNRTDEGIMHLKQSLSHKPTRKFALRRLGEGYLMNQEYQQAIDMLTQSIAYYKPHDKQFIQILELLAYAYHQNNKRIKSMESLQTLASAYHSGHPRIPAIKACIEHGLDKNTCEFVKPISGCKENR